MAFLGRRLIRWVIHVLASQGMKEYFIIAHGKENRYQIKVLIGYGKTFGVDIQYSPVKFDPLSTGSADSTLRLLDYWDIDRPALVFPTDSIIDFDLEPMLRQHLETGAAATIAAMTRVPVDVAEKYGLMLTDPKARILEFVEKPTMAELREHFQIADEGEFQRLPLLTNAGFYIIDPEAMRKAAAEPEVQELRRKRLDFGKDLLPWLVGHDWPVYAYPAGRIGDLGNVRDYLQSTIEVLHGGFPSIVRLMEAPTDPEASVWISPESLHLRDESTGKSLEEKMAEGLVTIGPYARIGRYCEIGPGVVITESNLDDDVEVREGAYIARSSIRDGAIIGPGSTIRDAFVGSMSEIRSTREQPTVLEDYVAVGDEVTVYPGVRLAGDVNIFPRLKVPTGIEVPRGSELTTPDDVLDLL
jgi:NDP-sugar pyrophosphorylase family protein